MKVYAFTPALLILFIISLFSFADYNDNRHTPLLITGGVEGTVVLAPKNRPVRFGGGLYGRPAPSGSAESSTDSVLVVITGGSPANRDSDIKYLNQKDQQFVPQLLPIRLNQTLRIQNSDPVYHNVFSLTSPHKFDVGRRPKGDHFDVTFEKPGVVDVFCDIHSNMHANIYVLPSDAVTWTKVKSGEPFRITDIPDGRYELRFYALGYKENSREIIINSGETTQAGSVTLNP